jgi:serine/threonine protein phosphatase 1
MKLFVVGDIHGCKQKLFEAMEKVGFDTELDQLWCVGDLVDRGPESMEVLRLLKEPWFDSILGNHEEMIVLGYQGSNDHAICSLQNGGGWFPLMSDEEVVEAFELMKDLPVVQTLRSPSGRKIGLVHAEPPLDDWDECVAWMGTDKVRDVALWGRNILRGRRHLLKPIANVDHVYCGHTPLHEPKTIENVSWIDTGACFPDGKLTMVEVL